MAETKEKKEDKKGFNWNTFYSIVIPIIPTIALAWFAYNQYTHNQMTDLRIEQVRKDTDNKLAANNRQMAVIYGELWTLLTKLDVDRCFIIQPHPKNKHIYLSVIIEVDKKGVSAVKEIFQNVPFSDMAPFTKELATNLWLSFDDVDNQVMDRRTKSLMQLSGSMHIAIRQLSDITGSWIGSIVVENIKSIPLGDIKREVDATANTIQFILPDIP